MITNKKKLFVIGDSISIHYGPFLSSMVEDAFIYQRKGQSDIKLDCFENIADANGGDSSEVLRYLEDRFIDDQLRPDILILNAGLHDIKTDPHTGEKRVSSADYKKNLETIVKLINDREMCFIWVNTTPVNDQIHNSKKSEYYRFNEDVLIYNKIAESIFSEWPIIDLYNFTLKLGCPLYKDHVHFFEAVAQMQAAFIAGHLSALKF